MMEDAIVTKSTVERVMKALPENNIGYDWRFEDFVDQKTANIVFQAAKKKELEGFTKQDFAEAFSRHQAVTHRFMAEHQAQLVGRPHVEFCTFVAYLSSLNFSITYMEDELDLRCPPVDKGPIDVIYYLNKESHDKEKGPQPPPAKSYESMVLQHGLGLRQLALEERGLQEFWADYIKPKLPPNYSLHTGCDIENVDRTPFEVLLGEHLFLDLKKDKVNDIILDNLWVRMDHCVHPETKVPFYRLKLRPLHGLSDRHQPPFDTDFANAWMDICQWAEKVQRCGRPLSLNDSIQNRTTPAAKRWFPRDDDN